MADRAAAAVSSGHLWLDPAGGRVRMPLRIHPLHFVIAIVPACLVATMDLPLVARLLFLAVVTLVLCVNVLGARAVFERWVEEGARRA